jgi:hypothetical protein
LFAPFLSDVFVFRVGSRRVEVEFESSESFECVERFVEFVESE